jgi:S-formylglutathione hydrolase
MKFSVFLPSRATQKPCAAIFFLAGLGSNEENFMIKAGAARVAEELGLILVAPDTSPRNRNIPREKEDWTFGEGAGFYLNATQDPWSSSYHMYDYVAHELPKLITANFNTTRYSIMGHSMGGHGALVIGLKNPTKFCSISAFSPICAPSHSPWGQFAFGIYLGDDKLKWHNYDTVELLKAAKNTQPILIDQGEADQFLAEQLRLDILEKLVHERNLDILIRRQPGYDHSYYFVASFIESHMRFHHKFLS